MPTKILPTIGLSIIALLAIAVHACFQPGNTSWVLEKRGRWCRPLGVMVKKKPLSQIQ
ncbi:hypothetical protein H6G91_02175 [Nostoc muscorum FACHB-395]|nr:hypothetical protein [Desmonostoc muscorum FACHB-395]